MIFNTNIQKYRQFHIGAFEGERLSKTIVVNTKTQYSIRKQLNLRDKIFVLMLLNGRVSEFCGMKIFEMYLKKDLTSTT